MTEATWLKAHAMVGVTTNIVTAISVTDSNGADSPELPALVSSTAQRFALAEAPADTAYRGPVNLTFYVVRAGLQQTFKVPSPAVTVRA